MAERNSLVQREDGPPITQLSLVGNWFAIVGNVRCITAQAGMTGVGEGDFTNQEHI